MLSNACKYAIRAVLFLGLNSNENIKFSAEKLANELEVPKPFLAQLILTKQITHPAPTKLKGIIKESS